MHHAKTAFRAVVLFAFLGLLLLPEGASAIGRRRPLFARASQPVCQPVQYRPVCPPPPPTYYYYPCPKPTLAPPTVTPEPPKATPSPAQPEAPKPAPPKVTVEPPTIRPAAVATPEVAVPATPKIEKIDPPVPAIPATPAAGSGGELKTPPTIPPAKLLQDPIPAVPAIPSPAVPDFKPVEAPKISAPVVPEFKAVETPKVSAPAIPDVKPVEVPKIPATGVPPLSIPDLSTSTSKSSPLTARRRAVVDVYPVDGPAPESPSALRKVVYFNHADRDVKLTVAGKTVTLPAKHSVAAVLPARFEWALDADEQTTQIPTAAPGVDVVIRK